MFFFWYVHSRCRKVKIITNCNEVLEVETLHMEDEYTQDEMWCIFSHCPSSSQNSGFNSECEECEWMLKNFKCLCRIMWQPCAKSATVTWDWIKGLLPAQSTCASSSYMVMGHTFWKQLLLMQLFLNIDPQWRRPKRHLQSSRVAQVDQFCWLFLLWRLAQRSWWVNLVVGWSNVSPNKCSISIDDVL